jgi:cysteine desulfurase / selenocysteine lyase
LRRQKYGQRARYDMSTLNVNKIREDFPILKVKVNGKKLVYLDNAATSQKPQQVIDSVKQYYEEYNSNIHRGLHKLSEKATDEYEKGHEKVEKFVGADSEEVVFTRNATESLNLLANSLGEDLNKGDEVLLTQAEHHANLVPWQQLAKKGVKLMFAKVNLEDGTIDAEQFNELVSKKTKIVSVTAMSNVLGNEVDVKKIGRIVHDKGAKFIIDGAQSVAHNKVEVKRLNCDFLVFSGHKMLAPTGIGALYGRKELLEEMKPYQYGGDMIKKVTFEKSTFNEVPWKFEAGTPNIAGGIGLGVAVDYLSRVGMDRIFEHEQKLTEYALKRMQEDEDIETIGSAKINKNRAGIISFNVKGIHAHDVASICDQHGVAIRGGHHCAMPLMGLYDAAGSARISFYLYNTKEEVDIVLDAIEHVKKIFK